MATPNFREGPSGRSDLDIRADHIASMDSFYEPARTNNYLVIIGFPPAMRGNVGAGIPGTQNGGGANENVEI
ncbi:MAG: hypothetical protein QW303_09240 [Nitrososphaerota archaeon]